jgi:hypothetical protein
MKKINVNAKQVGTIAKKCGSYVLFGLMLVLPRLTERNIATVKNYLGKATYGDAIGAVMGSGMLGSYKNELIGIIRKDETAEYYGSIIQVVNSSMLGSYKVDAIRKINEK